LKRKRLFSVRPIQPIDLGLPEQKDLFLRHPVFNHDGSLNQSPTFRPVDKLCS
jgi:hypothetical protein